MSGLIKIKARKKRLQKRYKKLIEEAYNWRQIDSALSDISEFDALRLLDKLNRLKYLEREAIQN